MQISILIIITIVRIIIEMSKTRLILFLTFCFNQLSQNVLSHFETQIFDKNGSMDSKILFIDSLWSNYVYVYTTSGIVKGKTVHVLNQTLNQFLGIPFAEPPIGDLRFAKPKPITKPINVSYLSPINCHQFCKWCDQRYRKQRWLHTNRTVPSSNRSD